jgi:23S rRNA pseudouridine2605 synthase
MSDPLGRGTVANLLGRVRVRVFPVGRLDFDAEGLLLLTNNGLIAQACLHPRYHVPKTYVIKVSGVFSDEEIKMLKDGVALEDGVTSPADVKKSGKAKSNSWLEITIHEGKKHQIKRMVEACGHRVMRIKRTRFGPLQLRDLPPGTFRYATDAEANALRGILHRATPGEKPRSSRPKPYLKNRVKARDTSSSKPRRKPLGGALARDSAKPRLASAKGESRQRVDERSSLSKRPFSPRRVSAKPQTVQGTARPSTFSKRPSSSRSASGKVQQAKGNTRRPGISKKPLTLRGASGKVQSVKGRSRPSAFSKRPVNPGSASHKRQTTKGTGGRSTFSKRGLAPIRKAPTKRRSQKG